MVIAPRRSSRVTRATGAVGSLVSLAALILIGTAVGAALSDTPPDAERPTVTVTYDVDH